MSRANYSDDCERLELYRGTVERSLAGKRGQRFLKSLARAMDEMPEKRLIANELINESGEVCAIGVYCKAKGIDAKAIDYELPHRVGEAVDISPAMAAEIAYMNDEYEEQCKAWNAPSETPEQRWIRMRKWVQENIGGAQ